jgi:hypothetical protein
VAIGVGVGEGSERGMLSDSMSAVGAKEEGVREAVKGVAVKEVATVGVTVGVTVSPNSHIKPKAKRYNGMLMIIIYFNIRRMRCCVVLCSMR